MKRFWPGETVKIDLTFSDENGSPIAALGVAVSTRNPAGTVEALTVQGGTEAGHFFTSVTPSLPGVWAIRATCSGPTPSAVEDRFEVARSLVL